MNTKFKTLCFSLILLTSGCASTNLKHNDDNTQPLTTMSLSESEFAYPLPRDWWLQFNSPGLVSLLEQSLNHNQNLQASLYRIEQARGQIKIESAALKPLSNLQINTQSGSPIATNITDQRNRGIPDITAGLGVSYNLDVFGTNQTKIDSKVALLEKTVALHHAASLVMISELSSYYFSWVSLHQQMLLEEKMLGVLSQQHETLELSYAIDGGPTEIQISQTRQQIEQSRVKLTNLQAQIDVLQANMALLAGMQPDQLDLSDALPEPLDSIQLPEVNETQPATLLSRRPDLQSLEAELKAADANIEVAQKAFYPAFNIGANLFLAGNPSASAVTIASSMLAPIFQGGRLQGNLKIEQAKQKELLATYQQTVLKAFNECRIALVQINQFQEQKLQLMKNLSHAKKASEIAHQQYTLSNISLYQTLKFEQEIIRAEQQLETNWLQELIARISLYKALAGHWEAPSNPG